MAEKKAEPPVSSILPRKPGDRDYKAPDRTITPLRIATVPTNLTPPPTADGTVGQEQPIVPGTNGATPPAVDLMMEKTPYRHHARATFQVREAQEELLKREEETHSIEIESKIQALIKRINVRLNTWLADPKNKIGMKFSEVFGDFPDQVLTPAAIRIHYAGYDWFVEEIVGEEDGMRVTMTF